MSFHVILVNPEESLNIGSVARAMKNLSFSGLRLVSPRNFSRERAGITACHAIDVLDAVAVYPGLADAIADLHHVVGFSARDGENRPVPLSLSEWALRISDRAKDQRIGLVFGPESTGLHLADVVLCHRLVVIPANPAYSSFNLSHAVLLALYELHRSGLGQGVEVSARNADTAERSQVEQLEKLVDEVAELSEFYRAGTPPVMRDLLPHLIARMEPQRRDLAILLGLFSRVKKKLVRQP
jgi:TrmH family RNA methyltransferase